MMRNTGDLSSKTEWGITAMNEQFSRVTVKKKALVKRKYLHRLWEIELTGFANDQQPH
jgi:hypothetical protein